jgi:hypothetical protein
MSIVQEFDQPVIVTDDFKLVFYTLGTEVETSRQRGEMAVAPVQFVPTQLSYTIQVSPFASGRLGVLKIIGGIQDLYGNTVDLKIGQDFDIYNTNLNSYYGDVSIETFWTSDAWPQTAVCPDNVAPQARIRMGPWPNSMAIPVDTWSGGNFYLWSNIAWKPDLTDEGTPFVWEPPFYYAYSGFGFPLTQTQMPAMPPWPSPGDPSVLYNITSSGAASQGIYDTCGWVEDHQKWRGRVQFWGFGSDLFADGAVPWEYPAIANPAGNLSPNAIFGFPEDMQEQFFKEVAFTYTRP